MRRLIIALSIVMLACSASSAKSREIKFLQLNIWVECTKVENAPQYLVDAIAMVKPDIATFCELYKGDNENPILPYLTSELKKRGLNYYYARIDGRGVISRFPIKSTSRVDKWIGRAIIDVDGREIAVYPAHSEYRWYACYLARGYGDGGDGNWGQLPAPVTDVKTIEETNLKSGRLQSVQAFAADADSLIKRNIPVILAGDFNEPSHLDWVKSTANCFDHHGCVVNWSNSSFLLSHGYRDAYRTVHRNALKYPGITWPADNKNATIDQLAWAKNADERDRIDFVYYSRRGGLKARKADIVGPRGSIVRSQRQQEQSSDTFITPTNWPTDHKGVLITFTLK
jgi:hypothetical protein